MKIELTETEADIIVSALNKKAKNIDLHETTHLDIERILQKITLESIRKRKAF